jgi:hypothetical protein
MTSSELHRGHLEGVVRSIAAASYHARGPGLLVEGYPGPGRFLLLDRLRRHVRAVFALLDANTELVLLEDAQPLQLGGDELEGVKRAPQPAVHLSPLYSSPVDWKPRADGGALSLVMVYT